MTDPATRGSSDAPLELSPSDIPNAIWPSNNELGIPTLVPELQADAVTYPVIPWGRLGRRRRGVTGGTVHFYVDDYKFTALWKNPMPPIKRHPRAMAEPNFSTAPETPEVVALWGIYRKRWLARYWQSVGYRIFVDLCVEDRFRTLNLNGVPPGWSSYSTRAHRDYLDDLQTEHDIAVEMAGTDNILLMVVGGGPEGAYACKHLSGAVWINEKKENQEIYQGTLEEQT